MSESRRLGIASSFAEELRRRERRNLLAVGVFGSVARGEDRAHSDIDLAVVVRRKRGRIPDRVRDGVLITVLLETREEAIDEVMGSGPGLHEALAGWRSMRALYDPSGLLRRLRRRARSPRGEQFRSASRAALLGAYEDLGKLWNAIEARDPDEAREMAIWFSGAAAESLFTLDRRVVRTGRRWFVELRRYGALGGALRRLRYGTLSLPETRRLSHRVWSSLLLRATRAGVEVSDLDGRSRDTF